jgi:hypothetical protein
VNAGFGRPGALRQSLSDGAAVATYATPIQFACSNRFAASEIRRAFPAHFPARH